MESETGTFRKYRTEFGVNSYETWGAILQQDELENLPIEPSIGNPQIYFIGRRNRIIFDKDSLKVSSGEISGNILVLASEHKDKYSFTLGYEPATEADSYMCNYPYTEMYFYKEKKLIFKATAAAMATRFDLVDKEDLRLEVLYIGQSFANSKDYNFRTRLRNHSTLQKIYSDSMKRFPHQDIWICLMKFEHQLIIGIDGITKSTLTTDEEDTQHSNRLLDNPISDEQVTNFTEAALIRYFEPEYNKMYVNKFPDAGHSSYKSCYDLEVNSVFVTLSTDFLRTELFSAKVHPETSHHINYQFHSREERRSMFLFPELGVGIDPSK